MGFNTWTIGMINVTRIMEAQFLSMMTHLLPQIDML